MLKVDSIQQGIVLDHIQHGRGLFIFERLGLREAQRSVALLMNVPSTKTGRKDMIKIAEALDLDLTMLGLLDPNITVNYIEGGKVVRKLKLGLPDRVEGILRCKNPRCITSVEPHAPAKFALVNRDTKEYACYYCDERLRV
jgi:aspartate carbamoyltransferase regulatory subunit